jgi:hypothetical protein
MTTTIAAVVELQVALAVLVSLLPITLIVLSMVVDFDAEPIFPAVLKLSLVN